MAVILVALLIILILGGLGFAVHILWWLAVAALVIWLLGFVLRVGETIARPRRRRWYSWCSRRAPADGRSRATTHRQVSQAPRDSPAGGSPRPPAGDFCARVARPVLLPGVCCPGVCCPGVCCADALFERTPAGHLSSRPEFPLP
jgi:hypothetical protein